MCNKRESQGESCDTVNPLMFASIKVCEFFDKAYLRSFKFENPDPQYVQYFGYQIFVLSCTCYYCVFY